MAGQDFISALDADTIGTLLSPSFEILATSAFTAVDVIEAKFADSASSRATLGESNIVRKENQN